MRHCHTILPACGKTESCNYLLYALAKWCSIFYLRKPVQLEQHFSTGQSCAVVAFVWTVVTRGTRLAERSRRRRSVKQRSNTTQHTSGYFSGFGTWGGGVNQPLGVPSLPFFSPLPFPLPSLPLLAVWLSGNTLASINVVALRQTRLVLGWVTVCGRVNHLGM